MLKRGWDTNPSIYTSLFNACANSPLEGDGLIRAKKLRQKLIEKNIPLNQTHYNAMIKGESLCWARHMQFYIDFFPTICRSSFRKVWRFAGGFRHPQRNGAEQDGVGD